MKNDDDIKPSLSLEEIINAFEELSGEADWVDVRNHITWKRGGGFAPYNDWKNYEEIMFQFVQRHCEGYRKFAGRTIFEKVDTGTRRTRFRLVGFNVKKPIVKEQAGTRYTQKDEFLHTAPPDTPKAIDIEQPPERQPSTVYRILRDTSLANEIKELHEYKCQICHSDALQLYGGKLYAEAHHVKPLGSPHLGTDVRENILCVCPNCHVLLDYGAIRLDISGLRVHPKHKVGEEYILYHNTQIYGKV